MSHKVFKELMVAPDEKDFESAALEGVWYPECPFCGSPTPAEPDAQAVFCQDCDKEFKLVSIA